MGIRSLTAFPRPTPPAPAKRVARKEKQRVSQVSPRWLLGFRFNARPNPIPVRSEASAPFPIIPPSHPGKKSKGRARRPFLWSFQGGLVGNRNPP